MASAGMRRRALASPGKSVPPRRPRLNIALRTLVGLAGGYGVASLGGVALGLWLPLSHADGAMAGILFGLLLWPTVFMAAFGMSGIWRLVMVVAGCMVSFTIIALAAGWGS